MKYVDSHIIDELIFVYVFFIANDEQIPLRNQSIFRLVMVYCKKEGLVVELPLLHIPLVKALSLRDVNGILQNF